MSYYRCIAHTDRETLFPSKSSPIKQHTVKWDPKAEILWCTCASWRFHHHENLGCKHVERVLEDMCGWDSRVIDEEPRTKITSVAKGTSVLVCPACGGPVEEIA